MTLGDLNLLLYILSFTKRLPLCYLQTLLTLAGWCIKKKNSLDQILHPWYCIYPDCYNLHFHSLFIFFQLICFCAPPPQSRAEDMEMPGVSPSVRDMLLEDFRPGECDSDKCDLKNDSLWQLFSIWSPKHIKNFEVLQCSN